MAAVAVEMSALSAFSVAILGSHQHSAFSSIARMIAMIAMIGAVAGVTWGGSSTRYSSVEAKTII